MAKLNSIIYCILFFFLVKIGIESSLDPKKAEMNRGPASIDEGYQESMRTKNAETSK